MRTFVYFLSTNKMIQNRAFIFCLVVLFFYVNLCYYKNVVSKNVFERKNRGFRQKY